MSIGRFTSPALLSVALVACADAADPLATAPLRSETATEEVAITEAATGGRASGRAVVGGKLPSEYSFIAVATDEEVKLGDNAKGEFQGTIFSLKGDLEERIHGTVTCLIIRGNEADLSGPIDRWTIDGKPQDVTGLHFDVSVRDNDKVNESTPDDASPILLTPKAPCGFAIKKPLMQPVDEGNIQVEPAKKDVKK